MHAIVCHTHGPPEVMLYEEIPRPSPGAGEILVQAEAIGVNYVDTMRRSGGHPAAPAPPFTPGVELCGRVTYVGEGARRFECGQRVIGRCVTHGTYAEFVAVEERFAVACPEEAPAAEMAALFVNGQTAYHGLKTIGHVQPGESVLLTAAAGGVGLCAIQIGKLLGAQVIAAAGSKAKRELASQFGADVVVDYTQDDWPAVVLDATSDRGADLILESVGGQVAAGCLECWSCGGRLVVFGKASGEPAVVTTNELLFGNRTAYGMAVGTIIEDESLMRRAMDALFTWYRDKKLRVEIGHTFPLSEAAEAHRQLQARQTHGKIVLLPE